MQDKNARVYLCYYNNVLDRIGDGDENNIH